MAADSQNGLSLQPKFSIMFLNMMNPVLLFSLPGGGEWILIILVVLLLFGGKKIPELMRGIGRGMREFNDAKNSVKNEIEEGMREKPTTPASAPKQEAQ